jgi:hypothetical protein
MVLLRHLAGQPVPEAPVVLKALVDGRAFRATICSEVTFTTYRFSAPLRLPIHGCFSPAGTIWR